MAGENEQEEEAPVVVAEGQEAQVETPTEGQEGEKEASAAPAQDSFVKTQLEKRIGKLTARLRSAEAALVAKQAGGAEPSASDQAAIQRLIEERAEALAATRVDARFAEREINRKADETVAAGKAAYGEAEFLARVEQIKTIRDDSDPKEISKYDTLIAAMIETGEAPKLIYQLGGDLAEASRLMELSPLRLGIELARLAAKDPPAKVSGAPKPLTVVGNRGRAHEPLTPQAPEGDRLSTAEWMRRRTQHAEEVNKESGRRML